MRNETIGRFNVVSALATLTWALGNPVFVLFLMARGLAWQEAGLLFVYHAIAVTLAEIPTGAFADAYGRKKAAAVCFLLTPIWIVLLVALPPHQAVMAGFLIGIADAFYSGAMDAWAVNRLKQKGEHHLVPQLFASGYMVTMGVLLVGSVVGGFIGRISMPLAMLAGIPFSLYGAYYCLSLDEKTPKKKLAEAARQLAGQASRALSEYAKNEDLKYYAIISFGIGAASFAPFAFWNAGFASLAGWGTGELGLLFAAFAILTMAGAKFGEKAARHKYTFAISLALAGACMFLTGWIWLPIPALAAYLAFEFFWGVQNPVKNSILHSNSNDRQRATIVSISSMVYRIGWALAGIIVWLVATPQIGLAWAISGIVFAIAAFFAYARKF